MSIIDLVEVIAILLIFSMSVFIGHVILTEYRSTIIEMDLSDQAINASDQGLVALLNMDYMYVFLVVGLMIAVIIGAFMIPTHPVFIVISILIFGFILVVTPQIANVFFEFAAASELGSTPGNFTIMDATWRIMPYIVLFFGAVVLIVMYAKWSGGGREVSY